jgi:hypothetical protein
MFYISLPERILLNAGWSFLYQYKKCQKIDQTRQQFDAVEKLPMKMELKLSRIKWRQGHQQSEILYRPLSCLTRKGTGK